MRRNLARLCSFGCQCRIPRTIRAQTTFAAHTATDLPAPAPLPPKYSTAQSIHAAQTPDAFPKQTPERGSTKSTERPTKSNKVTETRSFEFKPSRVKLRTWLPDEIYTIIQQHPTAIPSSLPGLTVPASPSSPDTVQLPPVPLCESEQEQFLEDERNHRPRQLIYRFYACGGFWLCPKDHVAHFLQSFDSYALLDSVPFIRKVLKADTTHYVPHFYLHRTDHVTEQMQRIMELKRIFNIHDVYNELFRALAWNGRDEEFLSLWQEAEKLGARFTWHSYVHLFRCFARAPKLRIREAIEAYNVFQIKIGAPVRAEAIVANSLLVLILNRITPSVLSEESRIDEVVELMIRLFYSISKVHRDAITGYDKRLSNYAEPLTSAQQRVIIYFRLCRRLRSPSRLVDSYKEAKSRGVKFTPAMYAFALAGVATHPQVFTEFSSRVMGDMAADGLEPDVDTVKALLQGAAAIRDLLAALTRFKTLEQAGQVDIASIKDLLWAYMRTSLPTQLPKEKERPNDDGNNFFIWTKYLQTLGLRPRAFVHRFEIETRRLFDELNLKDIIPQATVIPLHDVPTNLPMLVVNLLSLIWYLGRRYPGCFTDPQIFNLFMSYMIKARIRSSVPAIFRDCYAHTPLTPDQQSQLDELQKDSRSKKFKWHWPLTDVLQLPRQLPRPDKYTFVRAMEYAYLTRNASFASEVWLRRESWRNYIDSRIEEDLSTARWSQFDESENLVRYEEEVRNDFADLRNWSKIASLESEKSDGASSTLYEGYVRLLYIQTLASCGMCQEALGMIRRGTGEKYEWRLSMLSKVRDYADEFQHKGLAEYIDGLENLGIDTENQRE